MLSKQSYELIEKYLSEDLVPEEQELFNQSLKNPEFREQLNFQASMVDHFIEDQNEKILNEIKNQQNPKGSTTQLQKKRSFWPLLVAIGLVLLLAAFLVFKMFEANRGPELYAEYFKPYPPTVVERGQGQEMDAVFKNAMKAYVDEDYSGALPLFVELGDDNEQILLYQAMCLLEENNFDQAKKKLTDLTASKDERIRQNAEWYLALLYLKTNEAQRTIDLLNPISQDANHLFNRDAKRLLIPLMKKG